MPIMPKSVNIREMGGCWGISNHFGKYMSVQHYGDKDNRYIYWYPPAMIPVFIRVPTQEEINTRNSNNPHQKYEGHYENDLVIEPWSYCLWPTNKGHMWTRGKSVSNYAIWYPYSSTTGILAGKTVKDWVRSTDERKFLLNKRGRYKIYAYDINLGKSKLFIQQKSGRIRLRKETKIWEVNIEGPAYKLGGKNWFDHPGLKYEIKLNKWKKWRQVSEAFVVNIQGVNTLGASTPLSEFHNIEDPEPNAFKEVMTWL